MPLPYWDAGLIDRPAHKGVHLIVTYFYISIYNNNKGLLIKSSVPDRVLQLNIHLDCYVYCKQINYDVSPP